MMAEMDVSSIGKEKRKKFDLRKDYVCSNKRHSSRISVNINVSWFTTHNLSKKKKCLFYAEPYHEELMLVECIVTHTQQEDGKKNIQRNKVTLGILMDVEKYGNFCIF